VPRAAPARAGSGRRIARASAPRCRSYRPTASQKAKPPPASSRIASEVHASLSRVGCAAAPNLGVPARAAGSPASPASASASAVVAAGSGPGGGPEERRMRRADQPGVRPSARGAPGTGARERQRDRAAPLASPHFTVVPGSVESFSR
jgi:hypothetical protein